MLRRCIQRQMFSINPDRSSRFFALRFKLKSSLPESFSPQYKKLVQDAQNRASLLFAGNNNGDEFYHLFQSQNEIEPYQFLRKTPFYKQKLIESHAIEQIEMKKRVQDKELAPKHLRDQ